MKLLREEIDSLNIETYVIEEGEAKKKNYYIKGPFIVAEAKNKNNRVYPAAFVEREVNKFIEEKIKKRIAGGELNHPSLAEVNPERISHYITELTRDGNVWMGKAKVASTPMGQIVKNLLEDGYRLGVSTRGLGTVGKNGIVESDFALITVDCVGNPSGPGCFVDPILEAKDYIVLKDGRIAEKAYENFESKLEVIPVAKAEEYLEKAIKEFLRSM